jgi:hypothetical protein
MECPDIYSGRAAYFRSEPSKIVREYPNVDLSLEKLCRGMMPNHTAMYINKSVFERVGLYSESFRIAGDFEFLFRFCSACSPTVQADSKIISLMQTGGASTGGIRSMITLNREMIKITRIYGFNLSIWKLLLKYLEKISELRVL